MLMKPWILYPHLNLISIQISSKGITSKCYHFRGQVFLTWILGSHLSFHNTWAIFQYPFSCSDYSWIYSSLLWQKADGRNECINTSYPTNTVIVIAESRDVVFEVMSYLNLFSRKLISKQTTFLLTSLPNIPILTIKDSSCLANFLDDS